MEYLLHIVILAAIYTILATSLDLLAGHSGLLSFSHAGFYGVGAYTSALLAVRAGTPFIAGVPAGMAVAAAMSLMVSLPSLRVRDDYFVIATFGFQMILYGLFNNWVDLTHGPLGITGIPQPALFGWTIRTQAEFAILSTASAGATCWMVWRITLSPFGRVLRTIRESEAFAESLGKNTLRFKIVAFAASAALAASAGSLYAHYVSYIDPPSFTVMESILIISMVIIGGPGSRWGPLIGAVVVISMPEVLRFFGLPSDMAANLRQIFYGGMLILLMMFRPQGLLGRYKL